MRYLLILALLAGCATFPTPTPIPAQGTPAVPLQVAYQDHRGVKPTPDDLDRLVARFERVVFFFEHGGHYPYATKWRGHVPVYVNASDEVYREAFDFAADLRALTGLSITVGRSDGEPTLNAPNIYIEEGRKHPTRPEMTCFGNVAFDKRTGQMVYVRIYINKADHISTRRCVVEEMAQALGTRNDDPRWPDSIFNDSNTRDETLSWADAILLRALYDERILIGMPREEAMPVARQVIAEILTEINRPTTATAGHRGKP